MFKVLDRLALRLALGAALSFAVLNVNAAPVDVNHATAEEIAASLNGVGMVKAQRIVDFCQSYACAKPEDLLQVKGVGEKTIDKNRQDIKFSQDF